MYPEKQNSVLIPDNHKRRRIFSEDDNLSIEAERKKRIKDRKTNIFDLDHYTKISISNSPSLKKCRILKEMNRMCPRVKEAQELYKIVDLFEGKKGVLQIQNLKISRPFLLENGATYQGQASDYQKEGYGMMIFKDGSVFLGFFKNDKMHGDGAFLLKDSHCCFIGNFVEGKASGLGKKILVKIFF